MKKNLFKLILRKLSKFQTFNLEVLYVCGVYETLDNTSMHQKNMKIDFIVYLLL